MSGAALSDVFRVIDLTGVFANAALGGVIARKERLDPIGFGVLAILSGLGGGIIRDTLLQQRHARSRSPTTPTSSPRSPPPR